MVKILSKFVPEIKFCVPYESLFSNTAIKLKFGHSQSRNTMFNSLKLNIYIYIYSFKLNCENMLYNKLYSLKPGDKKLQTFD